MAAATRRLRALALPGVVLAVLNACSGAEDGADTDTSADGGTLVFGDGTFPENLFRLIAAGSSLAGAGPLWNSDEISVRH